MKRGELCSQMRHRLAKWKITLCIHHSVPSKILIKLLGWGIHFQMYGPLLPWLQKWSGKGGNSAAFQWHSKQILLSLESHTLNQKVTDFFFFFLPPSYLWRHQVGLLKQFKVGGSPTRFLNVPFPKTSFLNSYFPWDCASECTILDAKFFIHK